VPFMITFQHCERRRNGFSVRVGVSTYSDPASSALYRNIECPFNLLGPQRAHNRYAFACSFPIVHRMRAPKSRRASSLPPPGAQWLRALRRRASAFDGRTHGKPGVGKTV
jgi:hypothetical protein